MSAARQKRQQDQNHDQGESGDPTFAKRLLAWYDREQRALPWRQDCSAYRTLVSELMLQQTVVATVIPFFRRFCERFPSVQALAQAREDEVLEAWSGLGYYRRARHLHAAARAVMADHGGIIPSQEAVLRTLPGVGPYTAAAVAAISYGERAFALDGNAGRVMARVSGEREAPLRPTARKRLHAFGLARVPTARAGDFAQAVMELGALVCTPTSPACDVCPVRASCLAREKRLVDVIPATPPRKEPPKVRVACLRVEDARGRVWLERRDAGLLAGTLALPMEILGSDEEPDAAAMRLWRRLAGGRRTRLSSLGSVRHVFTHRDVTAEIFLATIGDGSGATPRQPEIVWPAGARDSEAAAAKTGAGAQEGRWCVQQAGESWGGGVSSFARKTLALVSSVRQ